MEMTQQTIGAVIVVKPVGPMVGNTVGGLREHVTLLAKQAMGRVVLDMEGVPYVDSKGIETLVDCSDALSALGLNLKLCSANTTVCDALVLTGNDAHFEIHLDPGAAARSFL